MNISVRLAVAYSLLVLFVAVALSSASLLVFENRYQEQWDDLHRLSVRTLSQEIQTRITDRAKTIYLEIAAQLIAPSPSFFGVDDRPTTNSLKLQQTYQTLTDLLNRHIDTVQAIALYYPRANLTLSTVRGLDWNSTQPSQGAGWLKTLQSREVGSCWAMDPQENLTIYRTFPLLLHPREASAVVAVEFRPEALGTLVDDYSRLGGTIFVVDGGVSLLSRGPLGPRLGPLDPAQVLVTQVPVEDSGWTLVDAVPLSHLYQKTDPIRSLLLFLSLGVILVGVALAGGLSFHLGRPVDRALKTLSSTVEASRPLLKEELVGRLLEGARASPAEIEPYLKLLGLPALGTPCRALLVFWTLQRPLGLSQATVLPYSLAQAWESSVPGTSFVKVRSQRSLVALGTFGPTGPDAWTAWAHQTWGVVTTVCWGDAVDPDQVHRSFHQALQLESWSFVFPETRIFLDRSDLLARDAAGATVPQGFLDAFRRSLRMRKEAQILETLEALGEEIRTGKASSSEARAVLASVGRIVAEWIDDSGGPAESSPDLSASDLSGGLARVASAVREHLRVLEERRHGRHSDLVRRVLEFIDGHLDEDLSLDRVGAAVGWSPGYLSTVFRETTGVPFLVHVTEVRLDRARGLLETTRDSVQSVAKAVGFQTPAYFIRLFKGRFGQTPAEFRRNR